MIPQETAPLRILGRYALYGEIAAGGMATVHFGRLIGPVGFSRTVAIKRLHPQYAKSPEFVSMFLDEARLAARIRHPNVVPTLDVVAVEGELFLVMEYVEGESLSHVIGGARRMGMRLSVGHAAAILSGALYGLHAAHEAVSEAGEPLHLVHRDISPQNILVGVDGVPRVLDFGVAKAAGRLQTTREGQLKGKIAYMAPEQLQGAKIDRRVDVFAAGVVLWEAITGTRLFRGDNDVEVFGKVLNAPIPLPSTLVGDVPPQLDAIVMQALERSADKRFESAHAMARALERSVPLVPASDVAELVARVAAGSLAARAEKVARIEEDSDVSAGSFAPATGGKARSGGLGTRVIQREVSEPSTSVGPLDAPSFTQLSSGSISHPAMPAPRRGVPVSAFIALAVTSIVVVTVLALRHDSRPPEMPTVWSEPAAAPAAPSASTTPSASAPPSPTPSATPSPTLSATPPPTQPATPPPQTPTVVRNRPPRPPPVTPAPASGLNQKTLTGELDTRR